MTMTTNPSSPLSAPVGVEGLARLLERIRDLLASLPVDCLGSGTDASGQPYPIRDEVIHGITKALAQQPADKARAAAYRDCCDTPAYCSSVRRCTAKDGKQPDAVAGLVEEVARTIYDEWRDKPGFVGWVEGGNSDMQDPA